MSETDLKVEVQEPTPEQIEKAAAKQLLAELFMIQRRILGITMNSMLLVQLRHLSRGLMTKYRNIDIFLNEDVEVKFIRRLNRVEFVPTPRLKELFTQISDELAEEAAKQKENEDE